MVHRGALGPDVVIAGAARSGTSGLAAELMAHPNIELGSVKEPNYFSRHYDRGPDWYDGLYSARTPEVLRLDASTSYTYPQFPEALPRLAKSSSDAYVIYAVRDPLQRLVSHYLFYRHYFRREPASDLGTALRASSYYADVSDYARWLPVLRAHFATDRVLVVPFEALTRSSHDVAVVICRHLGLSEPPVVEDQVSAHQNHVVEFRAEGLRRTVKALRRTPLYLQVRSRVGPQRVRRFREVLTREPQMPGTDEVLASCDERQLEELHSLAARARAAVSGHLADQDARFGLSWAPYWTPASPRGLLDDPEVRPQGQMGP